MVSTVVIKLIKGCSSMTMTGLSKKTRFRFDGFDYFILAGAMVNLLVICYLVGYWLFKS